MAPAQSRPMLSARSTIMERACFRGQVRGERKEFKRGVHEGEARAGGADRHCVYISGHTFLAAALKKGGNLKSASTADISIGLPFGLWV